MDSLRSMIHHVVDTTSLSDPHEVASKVLEAIPARDLRAALAEALVVYVRTAFSRDRLVSLQSEPSAPSRSGKLAAVRSHWQRQLDTPLLVNGSYKRLRECTADDLRAVSESLRADARRMDSKADYYDRIAAALPAGATVAALDADPTGVAA